MSKTICEYPCSLDLWAEVVKAKYIRSQVCVFDSTFCIPFSEVGGFVEDIQFIEARIISAQELLSYNKVSLDIEFELILLVLVNNEPQVLTIAGQYLQDIPINSFDPPLTPQELKNEVSDSRLIIKNWSFDWSIIDRCDNPLSPCFKAFTTPVTGTCLSLKATVDIIDKLVKPHDVIVYAEFDPEVEV